MWPKRCARCADFPPPLPRRPDHCNPRTSRSKRPILPMPAERTMDSAILAELGHAPTVDPAVNDVALESAEPLIVTHLSTTDVRGGAARAAHRLHRALPAVQVRSQMLVAQRFGAPG